MGEYTKTFLIAGKIVHPRVAKVLESLSQLSPLIVPRDADQPKQGYLLKLREGRQNYLIEQFSQYKGMITNPLFLSMLESIPKSPLFDLLFISTI